MRLTRHIIDLGRRMMGDRRGNVALILALCALPLVLTVGFSIDLMRQQTVKQDAQNSVDHSALAAAISRAKTETQLTQVVEDYLKANLDNRYLKNDYTFDVDYTDDNKNIIVTLQGEVDAYFAALIGRETMPVSVTATAVRGAADAVELVLVLDNTDSMNQADAGGQTRITALKAAASELVNAVKENEDADVKVGVVPYGEYVNVGKLNKTASWLSLAERDQLVPGSSGGNYPMKVCAEYQTTTESYQEPRDGYSVTKTRNVTKCVREVDHPQAGEKRPDNNPYTIYWRWEGCVYSRAGDARLNDGSSLTPYVGIIERDGQPDCMTQILPLTQQRSTVLSSISGMRTWVSGRIPQTYIPSGLLWGINVLSPTAPFTEGRAYGSGNKNPRKIMVLMTDGENTMRYREDATHLFGRHEQTADTALINQTNADVTTLCDYAKSKNIEIYTVALGVSGGSAQTMLRNCATKEEYFFNAANNAALGEAFRDIAASINRVRLIR